MLFLCCLQVFILVILVLPTGVIFVMEICILVLPTGEQQSRQPALQQPTRQPAVYTVGCIESYRTGEAEHAGSRASSAVVSNLSYRTGFKPWFEVLDWSGLDLIMCVVWWGSVLVEEKVEQAGVGFGRRPRGFDLVMVRIPDH